MDTLPLAIRDIPPAPDFIRFTGWRVDGYPDGVHTGGVWISPCGSEYWKPLDGKPHPNADYHLPTWEAEVLELMAEHPAFPRNWRIEESGCVIAEGQTYTRRWIVRGKARVLPWDLSVRSMPLRQVLEIEQGLRLLNTRRWSINDFLSVAVDLENRAFILDLSCACPDERPDEEWRFLEWARTVGLEELARFRRRGRHVLTMSRIWRGSRYQHIYASMEKSLCAASAHIPEAYFLPASWAEEGVQTWVVTTMLLDSATIAQHSLTWAWSSLNHTKDQ